MTVDKDRLDAAKKLADQIIKATAKEVKKETGSEALPDPQPIPSGSMQFNAATCIGGWPKDRIIEIFGPESSGKTSWSLYVLKRYFDKFPDDPRDAFVLDVEHSISKRQLEAMGLPVDRIRCHRPDTAEETLTYLRNINASGAFSVVILDSIDAMQSERTLAAEVGGSDMKGIAQMLGRALREIAKTSVKNHVTNILINQQRDSLNMYSPEPTTSGGRATKYYATARIELKKTKPSKDLPNAFIMSAKLRKNKCGPPTFDFLEFDFQYGKGPDEILDTIKYAKSVGLIELRGSAAFFCPLGGERQKYEMEGTGQTGLHEHLSANAEALSRLQRECLVVFNKTELDHDAKVEAEEAPEE